MKIQKGLLLFALLISTSCCFAQFKLNGKIKDYKGTENLVINIPLVYGFHQENSIPINVAKDGSFSINIPIQTQKFASVIYLRTFHFLLLSPGKSLTIELSEADSTLKPLAGSALAENKVMTAIDIEQYPFFLVNEGNNLYSKLSLAQLKVQVVKPYFAQRDKKINQVMASPISLKDKQLIASELKYIAYNYLNDLARVQISNHQVVDSLVVDVFDQSSNKPEVFPAGPQYYAFADNYLRYLETKAFAQIKREKIPPNQPIPYYGISLDSANIIVKKYGKSYWRWVGSNHNLPSQVVEAYTYQEITKLCINKDLNQAEGLANTFKKRFVNSGYNNSINSQIASLKSLLVQNQHNDQIQIFNGFENTSSIYDIVKSIKGKVIYLDIWGTWCGPCKEELRSVPALKERFKGKDVAFVYLDMDEDDKDAIWREFIKVNGMEGIHLRKGRKTIDPFWKELLANATDKAEYYPQYFIFDKEGKLVVAKAKRPSDKEELYQQIESVLTQK